MNLIMPIQHGGCLVCWEQQCRNPLTLPRSKGCLCRAVNHCQVLKVPPLRLGVCTITVWGHAGTQLQGEIPFSMLLISAGTNGLLPTGRPERSAMPLMPSQRPLRAALPGVPQVRPGCWGLGQCERTEEEAEQGSC